MQRLRGSGSSIFRSVAVPNLKRKALNSWSAVHDTYLSTKDVFERHRVVFTISTSIASLATAWAGYTLRYAHQSKVEKKLELIEQAMKNNAEHSEITKIANSGNFGSAACIASTGTSLIIGYVLGWRGGNWSANRKFRREQMKLLGQIKPLRWQFLRRPFTRSKVSETTHKTSEISRNNDTLSSQRAQQSS
ncbi:triacylglycerol lipase-like protein [Tasmannia lanceolata]|uniref:triacylglycerol lipase-like protein n=1 Tax=Tasmannia lanceolata TaxID=3420 RepID=UPI0040636661